MVPNSTPTRAYMGVFGVGLAVDDAFFPYVYLSVYLLVPVDVRMMSDVITTEQFDRAAAAAAAAATAVAASISVSIGAPYR